MNQEILNKMINTGLTFFNPFHNTHICAFCVPKCREICS